MLMQAQPAPSTARITVLRAFSIAGEVQPAGATIEVPKALATELVALNKAALAPQAADEPDTPAPKAAKAKKPAANPDEAAP